MDSDRLIEFVDKWAKVIGLLAGVGALLANVAKTPWLSCVLAIIGWALMSLWLWHIVRQRKTIRKVLLAKDESVPSRIYKRSHQYAAAAALALITALVWGWVGWRIWLSIRPAPSPSLTIFPGNKFGIIVAEFTQGARERTVYSGGADVRDNLYDDLLRLVAQQGLSGRVLIQQAGPVRSEQQAVDLGKQYAADMVIWGYIPTNQPHSFRPRFTLLCENEDLQAIDPVLFGVEITGRDIAETSALLTERVRAVSSFVLGIVYLAEGEPGDYERAVTILTQAIDEANAEVEQSSVVQRDLLYNLALFYLTRGRAYAAMDESEEALADYEQALKYWPNFGRAYVAVGNVYYARRDFETARIYYEKVEGSWYGSYGLGLVAYHQGQYDLAIRYFDRALSIALDEGIPPSRGIETIRFALGMAYKQSGDWPSARNLLSQVCFAEGVSPNFQAWACVELTPRSPTVTGSPIVTPLETLLPTPLPTPTPSPTATP